MSDGNIHCMPVGDLREHVESRDCWCRPNVDEEFPMVVVHQSMDRREEYEQGRKPS